MARPERFELPTNWFEASYSIQLSYGRVEPALYRLRGAVEGLLRRQLIHRLQFPLADEEKQGEREGKGNAEGK